MRSTPTQRTILYIKDLCTKIKIRPLAFCIITVSFIATVVIGIESIKNPVSIVALALIGLAITPYIYLAMMLTLVSQSASSIAVAVSSFLVGSFGILLFVEALFIHPDAYGETIFMVASVWQWAFLLLITLPVYLLNRIKKNSLIKSHKN